MRTRLVVGNWKMNLTVEPAVALARLVLEHVRKQGGSTVHTVMCPPFTALTSVRAVLDGSPIALGAQNCHPARSGAHTGEVSVEMLADLRCQYVIVGHSERRRDQYETDELVAEKAVAALTGSITPIVCVGETQQEHAEGRSAEVVTRQVDALIRHAGADMVRRSVIAYEPVWAIGTGLAATPEHAQQTHATIRQTLHGSGAADVPVLYGGSVTVDNAASLFACPDVDGALVGGASLVAASFCAIIDACERQQR